MKNIQKVFLLIILTSASGLYCLPESLGTGNRMTENKMTGGADNITTLNSLESKAQLLSIYSQNPLSNVRTSAVRQQKYIKNQSEKPSQLTTDYSKENIDTIINENNPIFINKTVDTRTPLVDFNTTYEQGRIPTRDNPIQDKGIVLNDMAQETALNKIDQMRRDLVVTNPEDVLNIRTNILSVLKNEATTSELMTLLQKPSPYITRSDVANIIISNMADSVGITAASRSIQDSATLKLIGDGMKGIRNYASRWLTKVEKQDAANQKQVTSFISTISNQFRKLGALISKSISRSNNNSSLTTANVEKISGTNKINPNPETNSVTSDSSSIVEIPLSPLFKQSSENFYNNNNNNNDF